MKRLLIILVIRIELECLFARFGKDQLRLNNASQSKKQKKRDRVPTQTLKNRIVCRCSCLYAVFCYSSI